MRALLLTPDVRVVTLTGAGGTGKTRLAVRVAQGLVDPFRDGVFLVDLAPLGGSELVPGAVAAVLGVPPTAGRTLVESLSTHLAGKELLLVLDNFEHVTGAARDVAAILAAAPGLRVLTTSRVPLRIGGEHEFHVDPLPLPDPEAAPARLIREPAVQLFVERAREIRGQFRLDAGNGGAIAEICRRLDGLPLAIELAAARTRLLPPAGVLQRLESRLTLLTGGAADLPARQRTLRDTIAWSYDLLEQRERSLLRQLGSFRGGCSLDAAERVAGGDVLGGLTTLAEHSLLTTRWTELGEPRFELLETVAEFAREELDRCGEADETGRWHAAYFADYAESAEPALHRDERAPWLLRLRDDRDNLHAALARSAERDEADVGLRILGAMWLWWWTAFTEGWAWGDRILGLPSAAAPTPARARALFTAEICAAGAGDLPAVRRYAEEAIAIARSLRDERTFALAQALGAGALAGLVPGGGFEGVDHRDGLARLHALSEEAIAAGRRTGDPWVAAWATMISGLVALLAGDPATAREWAGEAVARFAELGDSWSRASASMTLAFALLQLGEPDAAERALDGAVPALLGVGDRKMAGGCLVAHGLIARLTGRTDEGEQRYRDALDLCVRSGDPANAPVCLEGIAATVAARDPEGALRLLGSARALYDAGNIPNVPGFEPLYEATWDALAGAVGAEAAELLRDEGVARARSLPLAALASE